MSSTPDDGEGWETVLKGPPGIAAAPPVTKGKSALRNDRRRQRKDVEKAEAAADAARQASILRGEVVAEETLCPGLTRALAESLASLDSSALEKPEAVRERHLKTLRKKLAATVSLAEKPLKDLDQGQRDKLSRRAGIEAEIARIEAEVAAENEARIEACAVAASTQRRIAEAAVKVQFDEEFACPICTEPLEAATYALPCRHAFCRRCLEVAMARATAVSRGDPSACVCPLCRSCLFDAATGKLSTEPARALRKRMATKKRGTCVCGAEVSLSSLREHMRQCDGVAPGIEQKPKFSGHEFEQPMLDPVLCAELQALAGRKQKGQKKKGAAAAARGGAVAGREAKAGRPQIPEDYDEDAATQAAILASIEKSEYSAAAASE